MKKFFFALVVATAAVGAIAFGGVKERGEPIIDPTRYRETQESWRAYLSAEGPERTYEAFLRTGSAVPYSDAHFLSHIVGDLFYEDRGLDGLRWCANDFGFGCYHGVTGAAFADRGVGVVGELASACDRPEHGFFLGCIHGIGHGLLAHFGESGLREALEACRYVQTGEAVGGCYGGVFMEHNFRTMQSETGVELRALTEGNRFEPCLDLSDDVRPACLYELPSWWRASHDSIGVPHAEQYARLGRWCEELSEQDRAYCFRGVGNVIGPQSGYRAETMFTLCAEMSRSGYDMCVREALGHLLQSEEGKRQLEGVCRERQEFANICPPGL